MTALNGENGNGIRIWVATRTLRRFQLKVHSVKASHNSKGCQDG